MKLPFRFNKWHAAVAAILVVLVAALIIFYKVRSREAIKITLVGSLPQNGNTYVIDASPAKPVITAKAEVPSISPTENSRVIFTWTVNLKIQDGRGKYINYDKDIEQDTTTTGDQPFTLKFIKPDVFRGGELKLTARARVNGRD